MVRDRAETKTYDFQSGMELELVAGRIVLDGFPALRERAQYHPLF